MLHLKYIKTMGMKDLHKVLKVVIWMYMIDFPHNLLSYLMEAPKSLSPQSLGSKGLLIEKYGMLS